MAEQLTDFTRADMVDGAVFTIPGDGSDRYVVEVDNEATWIKARYSNDLIAIVNRITSKGFYWSKWYFGKRITGIHPWTSLRKVEKVKEVVND